MLFNKANNGAVELKELTASYYKNNKFEAITTLIDLEEQAMIKLVGQAVYARAESHYLSDAFKKSNASAAEKLNDQLVDKLRRPIALKACQRYFQLNLISHEDTGRKVKIDKENEILPWEWMVDRDDEAQARLANETTDSLLEWLDKQAIQEWISSESRSQIRSLFVNSVHIFQDAYPIDLSTRFFYTVLAFNKEVQDFQIRKALGVHYAPLLEYWQDQTTLTGSGSSGGGIPSAEDTELLDQLLPLVQKAIPLLVMKVASKRLSLQVMPDGVVQQFKSMFQGRQASTMVPEEMIRRYGVMMDGEANYILDDIKRIIQAKDPNTREYQIIPDNKETNKYFRT